MLWFAIFCGACPFNPQSDCCTMPAGGETHILAIGFECDRLSVRRLNHSKQMISKQKRKACNDSVKCCSHEGVNVSTHRLK